MPDDAIPASFSEAKELARRRMKEAEARAESEEVDATPQPTPPASEPDHEDDTPTPASKPEEPDDDPDPDEEEDEDDDASDDDDDDPEDDEDDDESDDDEEQAPRQKPDQKRRPNRRSKRIQKLQQELTELKNSREQDEERILARLQEEQARRVALEQEKRQREADDRALEAEMAEYLGTDEEYQASIEAMMRGDVFETDKVRTWHERRQIVGKLNRRAEARVNQKAAEIFWASTEGLAGVDKKVLQEQDFGSVLKHLHAAGYSAARAEAKKEIDKLTQQVARLQAQAKERRVERVAKAAKSDPVEGGGPVAPRREKSIYEQAMDPNTRTIDRKKFDELRRKAGLSTL